MEVYEAFKNYLVDYGELHTRFDGKISMWEKYVLKFETENSYELIKTALADKEYEKLTSFVHRMRGDALNLGFNKLVDASTAMLESLRNHEDEETILSNFLKLEKVYMEMQNIYKVLRERKE